MKEISIEITHDCALKCIFCSSSAIHPSPLGELPLESICNILSEAVDLGAEIVSLSGGEPLLHSRFYDILSECQRLNLKVYLYTSGIVFNSNDEYISISTDVWNRIAHIASFLTVVFDYQSNKKQIVEYLNGIKNSYEIILTSIYNAISCGITCETHLIPMKPNYCEISKIVTFCKDIGVSKISFLRFVPQGRAIENLSALALSAEEFYKLQYILLDEMRKHGDFIRLGHPIDFLFILENQEHVTHCRGGHDAPLVLPNGDVHVCPAWKQLSQYVAGNVFTDSLNDIWTESSYFLEFRKVTQEPNRIKGICSKCIALPLCRGGCTAQRILSLLETGIAFPEIMYTSPDPDCPLVNNHKLVKNMLNRVVDND